MVLVLPPQLRQAEAKACLRGLLLELPAQDAVVVVDAGPLLRFDSAALAVLLELRRQSLAIRKTFAVAQMPTRLADLAALYGIGDLLVAAVE
jgi:phospholipid transport system transporter-binding protein